MATRLILHSDHPAPRQINRLTDTLRSGGLVIYPTDTIYGLGCDMFNRKAIDRICQIKQVPTDRSFSFICADLTDLTKYARNVSNASYRLMNRLLPGPYTFVLEASRDVPKFMMSNRKTVGIRVPDNQVCRSIVTALGQPIISTSLTLPDGDLLNDPDAIETRLGKVVDIIVDAGILLSEPSTVVDLTGDEPVVLREGKGKALRE